MRVLAAVDQFDAQLVALPARSAADRPQARIVIRRADFPPSTCRRRTRGYLVDSSVAPCFTRPSGAGPSARRSRHASHDNATKAGRATCQTYLGRPRCFGPEWLAKPCGRAYGLTDQARSGCLDRQSGGSAVMQLRRRHDCAASISPAAACDPEPPVPLSRAIVGGVRTRTEGDCRRFGSAQARSITRFACLARSLTFADLATFRATGRSALPMHLPRLTAPAAGSANALLPAELGEWARARPRGGVRHARPTRTSTWRLPDQ